MLSERKFAERIICGLHKQGLNPTTKIMDLDKRPELHGIILGWPYDNAASSAPVVFVEDLYEKYKRGTSTQELAKALCSQFQKSTTPATIITNYESARQKLALKLINRDWNYEYLKDKVFLEIEDLALIPILVFKTGYPVVHGSVTRNLLTLWGKTPEEVMEDARRNSGVVLPMTLNFKVGEGKEITLELPSKWGNPEEIIIPENPEEPDETQLYYCSNKDGSIGAAGIFIPGVLEVLRVALGKDFFILPSSVDGVILVRDCGQNPDWLANIVRDENLEEVLPQDRLSDSVYHYSESKGFRRVSTAEQSRFLF